MNQSAKPAPPNRVLAVILALIYVALFALAGYLESIDIEDNWPTWALFVGGVAWGVTMLVLPFLIVKYFFGMDLTHLSRFSLRRMFLGVLYVSIFVWYFTQMEWLKQRNAWRRDNPAAVRATDGQAPFGLLRLLGDPGESRIDIENGTKEQITEARRLFPEATVVAAGKAPFKAVSSQHSPP